MTMIIVDAMFQQATGAFENILDKFSTSVFLFHN
jgi:hypothetical protein